MSAIAVVITFTNASEEMFSSLVRPVSLSTVIILLDVMAYSKESIPFKRQSGPTNEK